MIFSISVLTGTGTKYLGRALHFRNSFFFFLFYLNNNPHVILEQGKLSLHTFRITFSICASPVKMPVRSTENAAHSKYKWLQFIGVQINIFFMKTLIELFFFLIMKV